MRLANGILPWSWIAIRTTAVGREADRAVAGRKPGCGDQARADVEVMVMTGGPGVGKATIVRGILRILAAKGAPPCCCAHRPAAPPSV
jgi:exodeoxyribonuclease V alpha subunit